MASTGHWEATSCKSQLEQVWAFTLAIPSETISKQSGQLFTHKPQPTQALASIINFAILTSHVYNFFCVFWRRKNYF
jgi:hypothetical protein